MKITFFPFLNQPKGRKRRGTLLASSAFVLGAFLAGQEVEAQQSLQLQRPAGIQQSAFPNSAHRATVTQNVSKNGLTNQNSGVRSFGQASMFNSAGNNQQQQVRQSVGQFRTGNTVPTGGSFQNSAPSPANRVATRPISGVKFGPSRGPTRFNNNLSEYRLRNIGSTGFISAISATLGSHLDGKMLNPNLVEISLPANVVPALPAAFGGNGQASVEQAKMQIDRIRHTIKVTGHASQVAAWSKLVGEIDSPQYKAGIRQVIYLGNQSHRNVQFYLDSNAILERRHSDGNQYKLLAAKRRQNAGQFPGLATQTAFTQDNRPGQLPNNSGQTQERQQPSQLLNAGQQEGQPKFLQNLIIRTDPTTKSIIVEGTERDIRLFKQMLNQMSKQALANAPDTLVIPLTYSNGQLVARDVQELYDQAYAERFGAASIKAVPQPNAVVISGSKDAIDVISKIVKSLDVEAPVEGSYKVFRLRYASSTDVARRVASFFNTQARLPGQANGQNQTQNNNQVVGDGVIVIPDPRANLIIFKGAPTQIATAEKLVKEIDVIDIKSEKIARIIPLKNSDAATMAVVIRNAISGGVGGSEPNPLIQSNTQQGGQNQQQQQGTDPSAAPSLLKLSTIDPNTGEVTSGILNDVTITPDPIGNTLVVTAPKESIALVEMLVKQLDRLPNAETQIKVFTIANGDAQQIFDMMQTLFLQNQQQQQGGGFGGNQQTNGGLDRLPLQSGASDQSLVNLRFALEFRTNSIVASGSQGDLTVVEDLITHLDRDVSQRYQTKVIRLSNVPADDTANTLQAWANGRLGLIQNDPTTQGGTVTARRNVVIQQDVVQGHLIVTASPVDMVEIEQIVTALDRRPTMVAIEVMIAEVTLDDTEEFGLEYGIQDSLLFDRGIGDSIGFNFNQGGIGNDLSATGLATREDFGGQGLVNLNIGRVNSQLGYGGLVLSAGNESVSVLMRALKDKQRVKVLSRPQVMSLELLQSRIQVGQRVPFLTSINNNTVGGVQSQVDFQDVGIILEVVPRISPDGVITMLVNTTNSSLGNQADGIVVSTDANGNAIRQPIINTTEAISTVISRSGQTVVLGGLIRTSKSYSKRGIPVLSDLPRLGNLFSFQSEVESRTELLIFMTPKIIDHDDALTEWNQTEMERMNWCTQDVLNLSNVGYTNQGRFDTTSGPQVVYPSMDPTGQGIFPTQPPVDVAPSTQGSTGNKYPVSPTSVLLPSGSAEQATHLPAAAPEPEKPSLVKRTFQKVFNQRPTWNSKKKPTPAPTELSETKK